MFHPGEYVVYGSIGVCRVGEVVERKFEGLDAPHLYYVLSPVYQGGVLYAPADNPNIGLRAVITADEANRLIDAIPTLAREVFHSRSAQELNAHYEAAMRTCDCGEVLRMLLSIYDKKRALAGCKRKFGHVDERFMRRGEDSLSGEFAVALGIPREEVRAYIARRVAAVQN